MSSDLRHWSHDFFTEFIELYQSFPCLWHVKSKEYSNRDKKNQAYAALLNKYKEVDREATKESVTKKINSFRTVYRKECAKIKASKRSGAGTDEIYKPSLWYFDLLSFLNDEDQQPRKSRSNIDGSEKEGEDEEASLDEDSQSQTEAVFSPPPTPQEGRTETVSGCDTPSVSSSSRASSTRKRNRSKSNNDPTTEVLHLAGEKLKAIRSDDEFDAYGKYIAHKLRDLKGNQHIYARKLINDVIFEAELEGLTKDFKIVNCSGTSRGRLSMCQSFPTYNENLPNSWNNYPQPRHASQFVANFGTHNQNIDYNQPANLPKSSMVHSQPSHEGKGEANSNTNVMFENSSRLPGISQYFSNFDTN